MDEAAWLAWDEPYQMLEFVKLTASNRQSRLFACACCRRIWTLIEQTPFREAVEVAERYADGLVTEKVRKSLAKRLRVSYDQRLIRFGPGDRAANAALDCLQKDTGWHPGSRYSAVRAVELTAAEVERDRVRKQESAAQAALLRDIFGNPFAPVALNPAWLTSTVGALAAAIYAGRAFHDLPILADASQEAGCDDAELLGHCRGGGVHVKGCWVLDLLTGRG